MDFFTASKSPAWDSGCVGVPIVLERSDSMVVECLSSCYIRLISWNVEEKRVVKNNSEIYGICGIYHTRRDLRVYAVNLGRDRSL